VRFVPTELDGAYLLELERYEDERGFFARTWCRDELGDHGLVADLAQSSISRNARAGTLRGMHFQTAPHEEAKLVRCTRGAIFDVAVDLRPGSPTFTSWFGAELSADNRRALYIGEGCAHGFLTLTDDAEVMYQMSEFWAPDAARGARWDDPVFAIEWPADPVVMNDRDRTYADFEAET